jgi:RNA polymerase sigma-70 factor (ECF subfamily)
VEPNVTGPASDAELRALLDHARAAYPDVRVTAEDFYAHVRARCPEAPSPEAAAQLYFALACVQRDPAALAAFEEQYAPTIVQTARRAKLADVDAEEVAQQLRVYLLVGDGETPPKLADYAGRGDLRGWLRVVALRAALRFSRGGAAGKPGGAASNEDCVLAVRSTDDDPELSYLKAVYRTAFREAFAAAIASLDPRSKTLLRQHLVDGLTIDELAPLYAVHRATAARWVERARELLLTRVRREFAERARIPDREVRSALRLVESRLEVTLRRLLA